MENLIQKLKSYNWKEFLKGMLFVSFISGLSVLSQVIIEYFYGTEAVVKLGEISIYFGLGFFTCMAYVMIVQRMLDKKWKRRQDEIQAEIKLRQESLR